MLRQTFFRFKSGWAQTDLSYSTSYNKINNTFPFFIVCSSFSCEKYIPIQLGVGFTPRCRVKSWLLSPSISPTVYSRLLDVLWRSCFGHSQDGIVVHHVSSPLSSPHLRNNNNTRLSLKQCIVNLGLIIGHRAVSGESLLEQEYQCHVMRLFLASPHWNKNTSVML